MSFFYPAKHRSHLFFRRGICKPCYKKASDANYVKNREAVLARQKRARQKLKADMIAAYGGKCTCCGEKEPDFLTIEHIEKDGKTHRKQFHPTGRGGSTGVYRDLRDRGYPKGYTILCFNCNIARSLFGTCPHERA